MLNLYIKYRTEWQNNTCIQKNGPQCISEVRAKEEKARNFDGTFHNAVFKLFHIKNISD